MSIQFETVVVEHVYSHVMSHDYHMTQVTQEYAAEAIAETLSFSSDEFSASMTTPTKPTPIQVRIHTYFCVYTQLTLVHVHACRRSLCLVEVWPHCVHYFIRPISL